MKDVFHSISDCYIGLNFESTASSDLSGE